MHFRNIIVALLSLLATTDMSARKQASGSPVVMTVAGKDVSLDEFEYLYRKNSSQQMEPKTLDEYVDMFVVYKLKVADAEAAGIDTTAAFLNEFRGYRNEITAQYMTDVAMLDSMRQAAMSHYSTNVDVSHIMFPPDAPRAYVDSVYTSLANGADFAATASKLSIDGLSSGRGGRLGFIAAGRYPYTFEDAAYNTPVGGISKPVASHAGIHIIKVNDRRDDIGQIKVRHILKLTRGLDNEGINVKRQAIDSIAALIAAGGDFATIASMETDDPSGRSSGGELAWFGAGVMVPEFENAAFSLDKGSMSGVIESPYGFHIILCEERRSSLPPDEIATRVNEAMNADGRTNMARNRFFDRLRSMRPELASADNEALAEAAITSLPALNPELGNLINEYRDGMLLYEISNREVWGRPAADTGGLKAFFESNRANYSFDSPRYKGYVIQAISDSLAKAAADYLSAMVDSIPADRFGAALRSRFGSDVRIDRVLAAKGDNAIMDFLIWNGEYPSPTGRHTAYMPFAGRIINEPEEASDVSAAVATDWQKSLEEAWISRLRATYPVKINRKLLRKVK